MIEILSYNPVARMALMGALFLGNSSFYLDVSDDPSFVPGFLLLLFMYIVGFITIRRMVDLKV